MRRFRSAVIVFVAAVVGATLVQGAAAAAPAAITGTVSAIGGTTATLNGTVNPGGAATDWWFEYGTSASYGSKTTATAAGSGSANVAVLKSLSGLAPATTYHYRLVAKSSSGTTNGGDGLFTTASPPIAVTAAATGVGPATATLGGTVNPNGQSTTWYVEYGTSTSYGTKTAATDAGSGTSSKTVSTGVSGLTAGKTYHFRLVATSSAGTALGADMTFVTAEAPAATTSAASSVGSTSAKLNGKVDPNGRSTTYHFEYGTTTGYGTKTSSSSAGSGTNSTSVSKNVNGLTSGTTYHFRLVAASDAGTVTGTDQVFTTQSAPTVISGQATGVGPTSATLGGSVNPNGRSTSWYFEYGTSTSYGLKTSSRSAGSGTATLTVVATVSNLTPGVTYHFRLVASNSLGTTRGADATFGATGPPSAATGPVEFATLSLSSARVNGTVNARGLATTWWFEYGRTRGYGFRTVEAGTSGTADLRIGVLLTGLSPGVRWHYRLVARSAAGTSAGADASFATAPRPVDPSGRPVRCTVVGTQAADVLRGTRGRDVICGLGGNDRILGGGGADLVYGGPGADVIDGGIGNDVLRGGAGNDQLIGRSGNDRLEGGAGADRLDGGTGQDVLLGGAAPDVLLARDGRRDLVDGGGGTDLAIADRKLDRLVSIERRRFS
jgi:Ca2+-binding RTX toxin-like protein